jgi:hypothetical protein
VARKRGRTFAVAVLYGERSDWLRNLLAAGGGQVVRAGRTYELTEPRLISGRDAPWPLGHMAEKVLVGELGERSSDFGRGPRPS